MRFGGGFAAADLHLGNENLVRPAVRQSAALFRVSQTYVRCALRRMDQRDLIENGALPLVPPVIQLALPVSKPIQDQGLVALAATVGAARWLDAAVRAGI